MEMLSENGKRVGKPTLSYWVKLVAFRADHLKSFVCVHTPAHIAGFFNTFKVSEQLEEEKDE